MNGRIIRVLQCDFLCPNYKNNDGGGHMESWISCKQMNKELEPWRHKQSYFPPEYQQEKS